ncbi:hypothetical protein MX659_01085 [Coriobacteriia bacterium Es71-Z0120]|uniref:GH36-type glycosyl hydrolase domain-containing protein n=1 Tax=Parvivirga hydrogeniphila TaxID=2939460 RepID=UPI002260C019|nr:glucoamylase family protein [Parvivirga hydrogeniphila]MCL4078207.1 hypothetical protein [Parvivirga hydrogeniphila]
MSGGDDMRDARSALWEAVEKGAPLRIELMSAQRLADEGRALAAAQSWESKRLAVRTPLLGLLDEAERSVAATHRRLAEDAHAQVSVSVAAEWLLDNHYLVEEQIRVARQDLPAAFGAELPRLTEGPLAGLPRIFEAVALLVAGTDARLDKGLLEQFVMAYQDVSPLTIGELWAVPIALRITLVENLARLGRRVLAAHVASVEADEWANRVIEAAIRSGEGVGSVVEELASSVRRPSASFLLRFLQRLRDQDPSVDPAVAWGDERLAELGVSFEELAHEEQHRQAVDQVSVANTITAMRFLSALEWRDFFEDCSVVDHVLRQDPAGVYDRMDFASRDRYRKAVEQIAKRSPLTEIEVAEAAVSHALTALDDDPTDARGAHVGYYLISRGRYRFEQSVQYRPLVRELMYRGPLASKGVIYWGLIALFTVLLSCGFALVATGLGATGWRVVAATVLALIPASDLALNLTNRIAAWIWPPRVLPKLDFLRPLLPSHKTLVVIPALLSSPESTQRVIDNLEVAYLANTDENLTFAVLGDLPVAPEQTMPRDAAIIDAARNGIAVLNARHGASGRAPFALLIRQRGFNERDGVWMGRERKRGAIEDLVRFVRGGNGSGFIVKEGPLHELADVAFVITLDADTVLPRDAARKLVCTIAHPLNRAEVDVSRRAVVRGYGLVQPRVGMSLEGSLRSPFAWLYSGATGIDPYAGAVSDTYQDVFGEGSFTGKGVFEVDVYHAVLADRLPENLLLSHDLLEGSYLKTALASDIEVLDDQPSTYISHTARLHRWVRGDWQTILWLLPRVPCKGGHERTPLKGLHRWKIADNLRRSLFPPVMVALAAGGAALLPGPDWALLLVVLGVVFFPVYFSVADSLLFRPRGADVRGDVPSIVRDFWRDSARALFSLAVLPHQAWVMLDAIGRAVWRLFVSKRGLLEWETAAESERRAARDLPGHLKRMLPAQGGAVALLAAAAVADPASTGSLVPLALAWLAGPYAAWRISLPARTAALPLDEPTKASLRSIARRTWRFFETFVTAEDHYLAPDNFQEDPAPTVAHRTSPTNMGLQLLATLTAHDLGYVTTSQAVDRTSRTLATMVGLERFRGHFYNWYDTLTLQPLRPTYVSTVDSGNLAGHLIALGVGLLEISEGPIVSPRTRAGIADTVRVALEDVIDARHAYGDARAATAVRTTLEELARRIELDTDPRDLAEWRSTLATWRPLAKKASDLASGLVPADDARCECEAVRDAVSAVVRHIDAVLAEIDAFAPWASLLGSAPASVREDEALAPIVQHVPSLVGLAEGLDVVERRLQELASDGTAGAWASAVLAALRTARPECSRVLAELRLDVDISQQMWQKMDFRMLFDENRKVFSIGFNTAEGRLDASFYDMLASECRLASFVAIAKGDVPQEHWFRLSRAITETGGGKALVSWSASMFEYLMPLLVMRSYPGTLLDLTCRAVVRRQVQYGRQRGVPWGVSESAFAARDANMTYQYQAFGVPGLGLKRGLSDDVVVAPYASMLALLVDPLAAAQNLAVLADQGARGRFGYYEAIDYTPGRVPPGQERAIVRAYMAHHQGMGLVALGNALTNGAMQERFHRDPVVQTAELLLQERVPRRVQTAKPHVEEVEFVRSVREVPPPVARSYPTPHTPVPATHFLSNGSYSVMVTNAGGGYSRWRDRTVTRYREDLTRDCWGFFVYLKDVESKRAWSAAYQPTCTEPDEYHVVFSPDKAEFRRIDDGIETHTEIVVSPEDDVEVRRLTVTNRRREPAYLEITSYAEITLAVRGADRAHRAFSNLFVETEALDELGALLFSRRPRSSEEPRVWAVHTIACDLTSRCTWSYETDRAAFLGRLGTPAAAQAIVGDGRLTGATGAVLDPICAIRQTLVLEPGQSARLALALGVADSRERAVAYAEKYRDIRSAQRALDLAWSTSQIELRDLGITPQEAVVYQRLASRLLLTDPYSRLKVYTETENRLPISALWSIGISGDYPILLVEIERLEDTPLVRQALLAHQYWRSRGFECDLVVLNTKPSAYSSALDGRLRALVRTGHALQMLDRPAGVHLRAADQIAPEIVDALRSVARAVLKADAGPIALQLEQRALRPLPPNPLVPTDPPANDPLPPFERPRLVLDNGIGGFDPATGEYVIVLEPGRTTPAPWINVFANPAFGAYVSEAGVGCTWALNSHENRISTWNNDPVSDGTGELLYLRDDATGEYWSPTPAPARADAPYVVRHAPGCTSFEHESHGLAQRVAYFVSADRPVRIVRVSVENRSGRPRRISLFHVVEWSLGDSRSKAQQRVVTWWDDQAQALMAHNWFNLDFPGRPAFLAADRKVASFTADRTEFLGRNGHPAWPAAMRNERLAGTTGRFLDNCGALQVSFDLAPGERAETAFFLGQTETVEDAHALLHALREPGSVEREAERARSFWRDLLGRLEVRTPDETLDRLINGPVLYQALACRFWGRTALYQSSGAFGFRDQLQDCLALLYVRPDLVREHIIEASRRQFREGDVLHWWQPVSGRGVRTRFVDDRLWLPFVVAEYVNATGDESVLDVETPFVEGPPVPPEREDLYFEPKPSVEVATVYEHCVRAIEASAGTGPHGLPLMGGGDWNDGMNRVGIGGSGESVWMAWFLDVVLRSFANVADGRGDVEAAERWRQRARDLIAAVEREAWDGAWYRRAYFDDGTPLGSRSSEECKIDAIAQAWAAISGAGDPARMQRALESVEEKLIRWDDGLVALLAPPFDRMPHDPGYIKGYVPGVRENGGQYTHAAVWVALAYAALGDGDEAVAILDLINPLSHAVDAEAVARYKVEPYALAADVYSVEPHVGRGGWTWYTGSAAWYYRVAVRDVCGLHLLARDGTRFLAFEPCVPKSWSAWTVTYRFGSSSYEISFENPRGVNRGVERVECDGVVTADGLVPLLDDGKAHLVRVVMLGG